jgi:hypothetical protein
MRPDPNSSLVWYVAYGSNLSRERLRCYLSGGSAHGAKLGQRGARDPRPPLASRPTHLPYRLRFAGVSRVWGGGKAFVRPPLEGRARSERRGTLARAWLVRRQQFDDVAAQESSRDHLPLGLDELRRRGHVRLGDGAYDLVLYCGELDDIPMVTFTTPRPLEPNAPSIAYLRTLARGLGDCHGLPRGAIARYLARAEGVHASAGDLARALAEEPCGAGRAGLRPVSRLCG